ncbi:MAG TPA: hypothetical protein VFI06_03675 [Chitinophagaceae bacterium]|nr:hypothetical protein [Chitinophagaceae bacterium]
MKAFILFVLFISAPVTLLRSQGCVAIRNVAGISPDLLFANLQPGERYIFNITNRYFEASKSFRGNKSFSDTLVTNRIYTINLSVSAILGNGWMLSLSVPVSSNSRNNGADHKGPLSYPKYTTRAFGLGDIRLTIYKWLLPFFANQKGNIQVGLGIKFATGNYNYQDYFVRNDSTKILAPVDQAIQLGDGGTGITTELNAFYSPARRINLYFQGYYLINPRDQNGVSNLKGRNPTTQQIANNTTVMSVPDQFSFRAGANFLVQKFALTGAFRYETVPVNDLLGGNKGFRRAASIFSVEPGISYKMKTAIVFAYLGLPFKRNIVQNNQNDMTPAAFADWVISFGAQFRL